jgi:general secretion pathway protein G
VLVVLLIIGLISTVVLINVLPARDQANVDKVKIDIATLEQALENYKLDNFTYPRTADGLQALIAAPPTLTRADRYREGGYVRRLPEDPWGNPYQYAYPGRARPYDIFSFGADGAPGGEGQDADIGNWD